MPSNIGSTVSTNRSTSSGLVDRFFFEALYARIGDILIEISTDGPGLWVMNHMKR